MYYFFSAILSACVLFIIFSSKKRLWTGFLLISVAIIIIMFPSESLNSAREGINLWLFVVVPSLLPFFILNDMMVALDVPKNISYVFSPLSKLLFNSSGYGAYAFIMSIFSGYPSGARITSSLIKSGQISSEEGQRILSFSSTSGPLFIIGAVGTGMLKSPPAGYVLFVSHICGAILNGIMYNIVFHKTHTNSALSSHMESKTALDPSQMLGSSISSSLVTCGFIGGYIILFSVIIALLNKISFFSFTFLPGIGGKLLSFLLQGCLEISSGSSIISLSILPMELKLMVISFVIGFGGLSILGQVATVIAHTGIKIKRYAAFKVTQGLLSAMSCLLMLKLNLFSLPVYGTAMPAWLLAGAKFPLTFEMLLLLLLIVNLTGSIVNKSRSKDL